MIMNVDAEKHGFIFEIDKIIHVLFFLLYFLHEKTTKIIYIYQSIVNSKRRSSKLELKQNENSI